MNNILWLIRREVWENRSLWIAPLTIAGVILVIAALTGGGLLRALLVALAYFVVATAWTWFRFRQRETRAAPPKQVGEDGEPR